MPGRGYAKGVERALAVAGLYFSGVAPLVQFAVFHNSTPAYPYPALIWAVFALHALVWTGAVLRWLPAVSVLGSWALISVVVAAQVAMAGVDQPVAPRNISLTIAATAALLLPLRRAVSTALAVSVTSSAALMLATPRPTLSVWGMAVQIPVYSLGVVAALGLAFREVIRVARIADDAARARLQADRAVLREEIAAETVRRRSRMMHDTIINTLAAIASDRITADASMVARRCAEDAQTVDQLRRGATSVDPALQDVFVHAQRVGIVLAGQNEVLLQEQLDAEEPWRRRELISTLRETVTNVAKHAAVNKARMTYDASTRTVSVTDTGKGMADTAALLARLTERVHDAHIDIGIVSAPGGGTQVRLRIEPMRDTSPGILEAAARRMARSIAVVMLLQFAAVTAVTLTFKTSRAATEAAAPLIAWLVTAGTLALIVGSAGRTRRLPAHAVVASYLGIVMLGVVYNVANTSERVCGLHPQLAWVGDAVTAICVVLVLVDGRLRVVGGAVLLTIVGVAVTLREGAAECSGMAVGLIATDILVIGAFYILRRRTTKTATAVAHHHDDLLRAREAQERVAVETALRNDGFDSTLRFSQRILCAVSEQPDRIHDPGIRSAAALEEGYLRALIGLTADVASARTKRRFVGVVDAARRQGVRVGVHVEPGVLDTDSAGFIVAAMNRILKGCAAGDEVSIGVFGPAHDATLIFVAPPTALSDYSDATTAQCAHVTVTAELGLVEVRWPTWRISR